MPLIRSRRFGTRSLLLMTAGAAAGLAIGALIAERTGGIDGFLRGRSGGGRRKLRPGGWRDEDRGGNYQPSEEEDSELAPEALSHMHVRGRRDDLQDTMDFEALEELEERVLEAFRNDPILAERAIDIGAVDKGTIELTGWVRASSEIGHALTLARGVPGVEAVVDRLATRGNEPGRDHSSENYGGLSDAHLSPDEPLRLD